MEIAAATIGITSVAVRASSKLWTLTDAWRDAPTDLHYLRDELTHTETFLKEVQQTLHPAQLRGLPQGSQREVDRLICNGTDVLKRIEAIIDDLLAQDDGTNTQSDKQKIEELGKRRKFLWLRRSHRILRWRKEMQVIRASICQLLISHHVSMSREAYFSLERWQSEVKDEVSGLPLSLQTSHDAMVSQIEDRLQAMEERVLVAIQQRPSTIQHETHTEARQGNELAHRTSSAPSLPNPFRVDPPPRRASLCDMTCVCPCHRTSRASTVVALLRSVMGIVAVSYAARGFQSCTNPACQDFQRQKQPFHDLHIVYHLPDWLSRISVSTFFSSNLNGGPQMNLRVYHRLSWKDYEQVSESRLTQLIIQDETELFKRVLREGRVSAYAVYGSDARPLLAYALNWRSTSIVRLLLQAGADPFQTMGASHCGQSVVASAFQLFINGSAHDREVANLFPISQYLEELDLPPLHLSVLEITHVDLPAMLQMPNYMCDINRKAGELGYTPIYLAAVRGNIAAIELLMRAGAEVNAASELGSTPLYFASTNGHYDVVEALLRGGADVNASDVYGRTPLHGAVCGRTKHVFRVVSLLLGHNANANARDSGTKVTPLFYAVSDGARPEVIELLLEHGANADAVDKGNASAITCAITVSNHEASRILVPRVHRETLLAISTQSGRGVFHDLAAIGDVETIGVFTTNAEKLRGADLSMLLHVQDFKGKTPAQLLNERNPSQEIRAAFERLLESFEKYTNNTTPSRPDVEFG